MEKILEVLQKFWQFLQRVPILAPLLRLLYSRKAIIAAAAVALIVKYIPDLAPVADELTVVIVQAVSIAIVAIITSLGYAIEDAAEKQAAKG